MRRAAGARELLDGPVGPEDRAATLADVERLDAWFGGHAVSLARQEGCQQANRSVGAAIRVTVGHPHILRYSVLESGLRRDASQRCNQWPITHILAQRTGLAKG